VKSPVIVSVPLNEIGIVTVGHVIQIFGVHQPKMQICGRQKLGRKLPRSIPNEKFSE
jgi:hypothetical protein